MTNIEVRKNNFVEYSRNGRLNKKNPVKLLKNQYIGRMTGKNVLKCPNSIRIISSDQNYIWHPNLRKIGKSINVRKNLITYLEMGENFAPEKFF